ncbi:MAG: M48 family metalloprotease, partial [Bdellovibrionales bacterium]
MDALCNRVYRFGKIEFLVILGMFMVSLSACSTNPATGERQFAGLMSETEENRIGYEQHPEILKSFGGEYDNPKLQAYVREIGARVAKDTERPDVQYKFFLLDSPVLNAFAVPGGYIYTTRGLVATANSEAELAGVLAHEVGHITGRHSAERYSRGVLTQLGATVASAAIGSAAASQAIGLGANLYSSSYSRGQESQADELGVRYLHKSGYDTSAMAGFLSQLEADHQLQQKVTGKKNDAPSFFSTHPNTAGRVTVAKALVNNYPPNDNHQGRDRHLAMVDGMIYGDSDKQGFARGETFYHPELGFTFTVPKGYRIVNQPSQILAVSNNGAAMIVDVRGNNDKLDPASYITQAWL